MRDERKVMLLGKHHPGKPKIHIYTSSGIPTNTLSVCSKLSFTLLTAHQWDLPPPILIHFTLTHLLVLSDEGTYRLYDLANPLSYAQHTLGAEVNELGIVSAKGHEDGFVVLTGGLQFLDVRGWTGGRISALAQTSLSTHLPRNHLN